MLIEKTCTSTVGQCRLPMTTKKLYSAHVIIKVYIYPELGLVKVLLKRKEKKRKENSFQSSRQCPRLCLCYPSISTS